MVSTRGRGWTTAAARSSATAHERHEFEAVTSRKSTVCKPSPRHHLFINLHGERPTRETQRCHEIAGSRTGGHGAGLAVDDDSDFQWLSHQSLSYFALAPPPRGRAISSSTSGAIICGCCEFHGMPYAAVVPVDESVT